MPHKGFSAGSYLHYRSLKLQLYRAVRWIRERVFSFCHVKAVQQC